MAFCVHDVYLIDLGVLALAKLVFVCEKWLKKLVMIFFCSSTQAGLALAICPAEMPSQICRSATELKVYLSLSANHWLAFLA